MKKNEGFSLVELIIVIALMCVLVGLLAPQFLKYVEQSRRSRDIQNADQLREAFLADIAEGKITGTGNVTVDMLSKTDLPDSINDVPHTAGSACGRGLTFTVVYDTETNDIQVFPTGHSSFDLTTESGISAYKAA